MTALANLVHLHRSGRPVGIYSVCSSHPWVLEATLRLAAQTGGHALIEATSNQVNQDGGYTGMRPGEFLGSVRKIAAAAGLPPERVLTGGDHLGPNCWQSLPSAEALDRSSVLVREYVEAGFRKIHLDCSMSCADDQDALGDEKIAARTAALCEVAEQAWRRVGGPPPLYVIGSEVPVPGGAHETHELAITTPQAARATIEAHQSAFAQRSLNDAWDRVIGLVVQPGVEFDHHRVIDYDPDKAAALSRSILAVPGIVFEAHSTDYQTPDALRALVRDHFAILKVGPGATFAMREALWSLAAIAGELSLESGAELKATVLREMRRNPRYWAAYHRDPRRQDFELQFSLSDRMRYYWGVPECVAACNRLFAELTRTGMPYTLLSQYLSAQAAAIREGRLESDPRELVIDGIMQTLRGYARACDPEGFNRVRGGGDR